MVVLSVLRSSPPVLRALAPALLGSVRAATPLTTTTLVRRMSSHRSMRIKATSFEWTEFKDHLHFYVALGLIPIGLVIFYANTFIGHAELADIPEGYEPQEYEYFSSPIKRWFSRNCYPPMQKEYEKYMHQLNVERQKQILREKENKARALMGERGDHRGWYYVPMKEANVYSAHQMEEGFKKDMSV